MFKKIAVSNWKLYQEHHGKSRLEDYAAFLGQLESLGEEAGIKPDILILREKEMTEESYACLLAEVSEACKGQSLQVIPHTFEQAAEDQGGHAIHLPFPLFCQAVKAGRTAERLAGTSVHSPKEARMAEKMGASYLMAGHIFDTSCKPGMEPRGIRFLEEVCSSTLLPVYAIGGIHPWNLQQIQETKAAGACMMSEYMML